MLGIISGEFAREREKVENRINFFKMKAKKGTAEEYEIYQSWLLKAEEIEIEEMDDREKREEERKKSDANNQSTLAIANQSPVANAATSDAEAAAPTPPPSGMRFKRFRVKLRKLVKSMFWFWLVMTLVFLNLLCAIVRHAGMPSWLRTFLFIANLCFLGLFSLEILVKMVALGINRYFDSNFNIFDFVVIVASITEEIICEIWGLRMGISALRAFRLLRLFKLTKYWKPMSNLTMSLINSIRSIVSLLFLLFLFIFIFALLGMQLFGGKFYFEEGRPGANFDTISVAMMSVFQVLTGEDWNEIMYDGIRGTKPFAVGMIYGLFFVVLTIFGNYTLLNVFLAIAVDNLANAQEMTEADEAAEHEEEDEDGEGGEGEVAVADGGGGGGEGEQEEEAPDPKVMTPYSSLFIFSTENVFRKAAHWIVTQSYFEAFIMLMILGSSIALALEDPINKNSPVNQVLVYLDYVFTGAFVLELVLKVISQGFILHPRSYIRDMWNILDFIVVLGALLSYIMQATTTSKTNLSFIKTLRVLRVLRPLKTINRIPKLKSVVDCLINSIINVYNILLVYLLFQVIFACIGVQLFAGKFNYCTDEAVNSSVSCNGNFTMEEEETSREWTRHDFHYDNVPSAWLTLFAISTGEGWPDIYQNSRSTTKPGYGPIEGNWKGIAGYYVAYFVVFPFFFVNMFVAFIIMTFQDQEESAAGDDIDKNQKGCISFVLGAKPVRQYSPKNQRSLKYKMWKIVTTNAFEIFIMVVICLNTIIMMMKIYKPPPTYQFALKCFNWIFTGVFVIEATMKIFAFGVRNYFRDSWNLFDFITVVGSIADILVTEFGQEMISVGFLRLFRAARLVKLLRSDEGIKTLLWTFVQSFKSLPYVCLLIFILFFVYAIVGMQIFGTLAHDTGSAINRHNNFSNFLLSFLLLFRCSTGEAWQDIMISCVSAPCHQTFVAESGKKMCGSPIAYVYFVSFIFLCMFLMLNLFVAVIMDNFDYLTRDSSILGAHQLDKFVNEWSELDPDATGRMHHKKVFKMLRKIPPPLGFGPNSPLKLAYGKMIMLNLPLDENLTAHFKTTLFSVVRKNLEIKMPVESKGWDKRMSVDTTQADEDLREILRTNWPHCTKHLDLFLPKRKEMGDSVMTTGKLYTGLTILENWQVYKRQKRKSGVEVAFMLGRK